MEDSTTTIRDLNSTYSLEKYNGLNDKEKAKFKDALSTALTALKKKYTIKLLNDDYLFSLASSKANFKNMEMVNQYRALAENIKNSHNDNKRISSLKIEQKKIRVDLIAGLLGSYSLFNAPDPKTITINSEILSQIMSVH
jgi:hypothetical protein